mgnify:CR=1 FL=1
MAVPKGKVSRQRRDKRRSSHWKLEAPGIVKCPNCGEFKMPHRACKACGMYNGRKVLTVDEVIKMLSSRRNGYRYPFLLLLIKVYEKRRYFKNR